MRGEVRHYLAGPAPAGRVQVTLDWARRFDHMQQHTGQHLLTAVAEQRFGWHTTAFHLGQRLSDIELDSPQIHREHLANLEEAVAVEIRACRSVTARRVTPADYAALPVRTRGLPDGVTDDIRLVEIAGVDLNTCGGTHVGSTAQIESLTLLGTEPMRGGTRLYYAAGARLRGLVAFYHDRFAQLRQLVGTSDEELSAGVAAKLEQLKRAQRAVRTLEEELAIESARALALESHPVLQAHWSQRDLLFLQRVAKELARLAPDRVALLTAGGDEEGAFLLWAGERATIDVANAGRSVAEALEGRGGGSGRVFQGKATALSRRAEALARLRRLA